MEQIWIVGGVSKEGNQSFMCRVAFRNRNEISEVLKTWVRPGSILYTDEWSAYPGASIDSLMGNHCTINHSKWFVDPITGVNTQKIESL